MQCKVGLDSASSTAWLFCWSSRSSKTNNYDIVTVDDTTSLTWSNTVLISLAAHCGSSEAELPLPGSPGGGACGSGGTIDGPNAWVAMHRRLRSPVGVALRLHLVLAGAAGQLSAGPRSHHPAGRPTRHCQRLVSTMLAGNSRWAGGPGWAAALVEATRILRRGHA